MDTFDERNKAFLPLLKMELILDEETKMMMFYPYFTDLKELIIYAVECVAESLQEVIKLLSSLLFNLFGFRQKTNNKLSGSENSFLESNIGNHIFELPSSSIHH